MDAELGPEERLAGPEAEAPTTAPGLEVTVPNWVCQAAGASLTLVATAGGLAAYAVCWRATTFLPPWPFFLAVPLAVPVHELLHAGAWWLSGVPWRAIRFGALPWRGMVYVTTDRPLKARHLRFSLLAPVVVLGLVPMAFGLTVGLEWATVFGALLVGGAGGDLAIFHAMRSLGPDVLVRDHPTVPGFIVMGGEGGLGG